MARLYLRRAILLDLLRFLIYNLESYVNTQNNGRNQAYTQEFPSHKYTKKQEVKLNENS